MEDAHDIYGYQHQEITDTLFQSRQAVLDIVMDSRSALHPIGLDYEQWMASGGELQEIGRANDFARKFFSAQVLPGDASLIEPHTNYVVESLPADILAIGDTPAAVSERLRRRATILAPLLFQLVILRMYLGRAATDDIQIYFLTRTFDKAELEKLSKNDPLYLAKKGMVIRHMTEPELVLQAAEDTAGQNMPARWCKIGTRVTKAAAARIPAKTVLASAYDPIGGDYIWMDPPFASSLSTDVDWVADPKFIHSSPLSEPPADLMTTNIDLNTPPLGPGDIVGFPKQTTPFPRPLKRKHEDDLGPGSALMAEQKAPILRRSNRKQH